MNGLLYAFIACFLAGCGARDQVLVAALTDRLGPRFSLLAIACFTGGATCALAAWAADDLAGVMNHRSRLLLASFALAAAGVESLLVSPGRRAKEPTRSLFAALLVLAISQIVDASRFIVLAIALLHAPLSAALGGTLGGGAAMAIGWFGAGPLLAASTPLRLARRIAGAILLLAGIVLAWSVLGEL